MRFEVLGPVRGWLGETELDLGSPQQRAVLAILLLARGKQVSLSALIDGLWDGDVPKSAVGTARTYVSRLRRLLASGPAGQDGPAGPTGLTGLTGPTRQPGCVIVSAGDGYALELGSAELDLDQFEERLRAARAAWQRRDKAQAAAFLSGALGLWRGAALAGIPGPHAESRRVQLTELQLAAEQERLAMDIASGEHMAAIADLRALTTQHPFREVLAELLMLALYTAGRQADALTMYDTVRRGLRDQLGIDPGPGLQDLRQRILRADGQLLALAERHVA